MTTLTEKNQTQEKQPFTKTEQDTIDNNNTFAFWLELECIINQKIQNPEYCKKSFWTVLDYLKTLPENYLLSQFQKGEQDKSQTTHFLEIKIFIQLILSCLLVVKLESYGFLQDSKSLFEDALTQPKSDSFKPKIRDGVQNSSNTNHWSEKNNQQESLDNLTIGYSTIIRTVLYEHYVKYIRVLNCHLYALVQKKKVYTDEKSFYKDFEFYFKTFYHYEKSKRRANGYYFLNLKPLDQEIRNHNQKELLDEIFNSESYDKNVFQEKSYLYTMIEFFGSTCSKNGFENIGQKMIQFLVFKIFIQLYLEPYHLISFKQTKASHFWEEYQKFLKIFNSALCDMLEYSKSCSTQSDFLIDLDLNKYKLVPS